MKALITLHESEYLIMGDNRNKITDSRILGSVKIKNTIGKI